MNSLILILVVFVDFSLASDKVLLVSMDGFRWDYIQNASTPHFDQMAKLGSKAPYINSAFISKTFPCHYSIVTDKVLLVSMDGFRWDYIQNASTPHFDQMAKLGAKAPYINSAFISKTFPCHYSIVTGLYEESHGIVGNRMYDAEFDEYFTMRTTDTKWWNEGEPIWTTAQKHGKNSAVYFWPGSETEIEGIRPDIWKPYEQKVPFDDRIDAVVDWLSNDTLAIDLALLYFHEPDSTGHRFGPYSTEIKQKVEYMDSILGQIIDKLDKANLTDIVNVIVTSDHGMTEVDSDTRLVNVGQYIDLDSIKVSSARSGPIINIIPQEGMLDEMYANLSKAEHMRVYLKDEIPDRWHYQHNRRVLPLLLVADDGWLLALNGTYYSYWGHGNHGYDNNLTSMKPIFYAKGPRIKKNFMVQPFNSVDIYPFICKLLGIEPAPNNGTLNIIQRMEYIDNTTDGANSLTPMLWSLLVILCFQAITI